MVKLVKHLRQTENKLSGLSIVLVLLIVFSSSFTVYAKSSPKDKGKKSSVYTAESSIKKHIAFFKPDAMKKAIENMAQQWPDRFADQAVLLQQVEKYRGELDRAKSNIDKAREILDFQKKVLLRNPLLGFDKLLVVRHEPGSPFPFSSNWQSNANIGKKLFDCEIARISIKDPAYKKTIYKPKGTEFVGNVDLHFDAGKMIFSSLDEKRNWQIFEIGEDSTGLRQVTHTDAGIHSYDGCYLPDGKIIFACTAPKVVVPCIRGVPVANLFISNSDGSGMRQLAFDQDQNWHPAMMADGRVLYTRWEYSDLPHSNSRFLMTMNPDGTNQRSLYGTNSWWPNSFFHSRQVPGHPNLITTIIGGHHSGGKRGDFILLDTNKGYQEADGVVQRIMASGKKVEPVIADRLRTHYPTFVHPYPLSDKYFLVAAEVNKGMNGIYLVDVYDNLTLIREEADCNYYEPVPLKKRKKPPVRRETIDLSRKDATVLIADIYEGPGLKGIPRGTVKNLRVYSYSFALSYGGTNVTIGMSGPWDMRRILGTVPVEGDGSASFNVPANTPIALQPLDSEGKALQIMRSWFVAMPGEHLSCIGCHEAPNATAPVKRAIAFTKAPAKITPWYGSTRNFEFAREVQPVLDRYCVGCHDGSKRDDGKEIPYLKGDKILEPWRTRVPGSYAGGLFSVAYCNLQAHLRNAALESGMRMHQPMEFHADTTELFRMLKKGHHNVKLDAEAMDRLITWFDLNKPYFGRWSSFPGSKAVVNEKVRAKYRKLYAFVDENHEQIEGPPPAPASFIKPKPEQPLASAKVTCSGWPFNAAQARGMQTKEARKIDLGDGISIECVYIPAGRFVMGSTANRDEYPATAVNIAKGFWMGKFEVTNRQFRQFDPEHDSLDERRQALCFGIKGYDVNKPEMPAVRLSWQKALEFCQWLSKKSGKKVTLATEAQWEWSCRAGSATPFNYGEINTDFSKHENLADQTLSHFVGDPYTYDWKEARKKLIANFEKNFDKFTRGMKFTKSKETVIKEWKDLDDWIPKDNRFNDEGFVSEPVGKYKPNSWGLHDMHGNVSEWTRSLYKPYPYKDDSPNTPPSASTKRVARGGSWYDRPKCATSSYRKAFQDYQKVYNVGFRIIIEE